MRYFVPNLLIFPSSSPLSSVASPPHHSAGAVQLGDQTTGCLWLFFKTLIKLLGVLNSCFQLNNRWCTWSPTERWRDWKTAMRYTTAGSSASPVHLRIVWTTKRYSRSYDNVKVVICCLSCKTLFNGMYRKYAGFFSSRGLSLMFTYEVGEQE